MGTTDRYFTPQRNNLNVINFYHSVMYICILVWDQHRMFTCNLWTFRKPWQPEQHDNSILIQLRTMYLAIALLVLVHLYQYITPVGLYITNSRLLYRHKAMFSSFHLNPPLHVLRFFLWWTVPQLSITAEPRWSEHRLTELFSISKCFVRSRFYPTYFN